MTSPSIETLTPKQIEIRQRERRILDTVTPIVRQDGIAAVSIDSIARAMKLTRGTIYNHFPNKEDILLALATRAVQRRIALFHFAMSLAEGSRQRCAAIGIASEVYADRMRDDFVWEQSIRHDSVWHKTSAGRREVLLKCETSCIDALGELISGAIACGDLAVVAGTTRRDLIEQITFGLWSLVYGGLLLEYSSPSLRESGIRHPRETIRRNCNRLLDQLGWMPLYQPKPYAATVRRIMPLLEKRADEMIQTDDQNLEGLS